jgi:hypothetical protein
VWRTIQTVFILLGLLLVFGGNKLSIPILMDAGIACLGLGSIAVGWEAIFTRHIVIGRRRHGSRQSYSGIPAMMQGVQFNIIGFFLIVFAFMLYQNVDAHAVGIEIAQHPGLLLVMVGFIVLTQAVIVLIGSDEFKDPARNTIIIDWLLLRLLPGTILVILALALLGSGLFEIVAPNAFDALGGKYLEMLYGLR